MANGIHQAPAREPLLRAFRIPVAERNRALFWRGALAVATDPPEILWHGIALTLSPAEVALLGLLIRWGRATQDEIGREIGAAGAGAASLDVIAYRIRRKFAAIGAADPIERRRGWGMILRVEADMHGSTGLWIGGAHGTSVPALRMRG